MGPDDASGPARRATIADVAAAAGVSRAAVSKVFNGTGSISPATTERIRQAAKALNWTPSATATALRRSRSQTIGLLLNTSSDSIDIGSGTAVFMSGIESVLSPLGWGLLLYVIDRDEAVQEAAYRRLAEARRVDGVILTDSIIGDPRFGLLTSIGLPGVLIGTPGPGERVPHVDSPAPGGGLAESATHLVELGHRRIAYVGGPAGRVQALLRRDAFVATLESAGCGVMADVDTDYSPAAAARATAQLLDEAEPPTAIVYASDSMAIAGIRTASQRGLVLPRDLSIIGYGGVELGEWTEPRLTTVERDSAQRGRAVAARILDLLGETVGAAYPLENPSLVLRGSTAPVAPAPHQ